MANDVNRTLFNQISAYLSQMDLAGLFTVDSNGTPGGWLWDQITSGVDSEAALQIALEQTDAFKQRYGVINDLRAMAQTGAVVHVPTIAEVRAYEEQATVMFRRAGLPTWMYDSWRDMQDLMRTGMSLSEVEQRLGAAWERVQNTDPAVRQAFSQFYGIEGDAALASAFLDPGVTIAQLERASRAAYTAGMGKTMGLNIDPILAGKVADQPKTEAGIVQDLQQASQIIGGGLGVASISEQPNDLTNEKILGAVLTGDGEAAAQIEKRTIERRAQQAAVPGGAARTNRGLSGVG